MQHRQGNPTAASGVPCRRCYEAAYESALSSRVCSPGCSPCRPARGPHSRSLSPHRRRRSESASRSRSLYAPLCPWNGTFSTSPIRGDPTRGPPGSGTCSTRWMTTRLTLSRSTRVVPKSASRSLVTRRIRRCGAAACLFRAPEGGPSEFATFQPARPARLPLFEFALRRRTCLNQGRAWPSPWRWA